jgi:hypothetical protein
MPLSTTTVFEEVAEAVVEVFNWDRQDHAAIAPVHLDTSAVILVVSSV